MGNNNIKFTQKQVEEIFRAKNCLLQDVYKNANIPLRYICSCGQENCVSFDKFRRQKHGCRHCTKIGGYTHEEVFDFFNKQGCKLISEYTGCKNKLEYICKCGDINYISFDNFSKGKRCVKCGLEKLSEKFRFTKEYVQEYFIDNNCIPLFDEYKNRKQKLNYICSCGNNSIITFGDFLSGRRCKNCCNTRRNLTKNDRNNNPTSLQQNFIHNIIGGKLNFPVGNYILDIAFPEEKIYVEYDGSGHNLSVKFGTINQEDFDKKSVKRNYFFYRRGWKQIRIISSKDKLPNKEKIIQLLNDAQSLINEGKKYIIFNIDNTTIEYQNYTSHYSFGKTKKVCNDCAS
jgi:very-short-patch-repair endonuclease